MNSNRPDHIRLTSHPDPGAKVRFPIHWGAPTARERGPVIGTVSQLGLRNVIGSHGGSYALYRALAVSSGTLDPIRRPDLTNTFPTAVIGPFPQWSEPGKIVSLDPWGHLVADTWKTEIAEGLDIRPSIAITKARLDLIEMRDALAAGRLKADGNAIHENGSLSVTKIAIDPVWYLPGIAERFGTTETALRRSLFEQTAGMFPELVTRPDLRVFLPPIGGITAYLFGDMAKLSDPRTKITCRVHDECNGSDVFGSDICTCRPYLIHGIEECARAAQQGEFGIIIYNRKEGRALGEVTKFLVYNARKRQEGGDAAATYFERTECVAGVQDARFQQLMPDALHWLGIRRIDHFVSMSDMKHDALVSQGIDIVERVPIPDELVPPDAHVEIEAKKAAGYYTPEPVKPEDLKNVRQTARKVLIVSQESAAKSLLSAKAVRERAHAMLALGDRLPNFRVDMSRLDATAQLVIDTTRAAYPTLDIPFHSRWRHFDIDGFDYWDEIDQAMVWPSPDVKARAAFDLAIVSVLLDAGAGPSWRYRYPVSGEYVSRSEGLALASLVMFRDCEFSMWPSRPLRADGSILAELPEAKLIRGFQVSESNPLQGVAGRTALLQRLGKTVTAAPEVFARKDSPRPGGLFDHLAALAENRKIAAPVILSELLTHLGPIWPSRLTLGGVALGDCWRHPAMTTNDETNGLVPLHKLSQWLAYSLIEPLQWAGIEVTDIDGLTGLAEYRNGGLFIDTGVLALRDANAAQAEHTVDSELVVEWRALTVALLDRLADLVRARLNMDREALPLARILQGGTWTAGRAIARQRRADGGPPLKIVSDGTVF